jgi:hypothetical protein
MTPTHGNPVVWLDAIVKRTVSPHAAPIARHSVANIK